MIIIRSDNNLGIDTYESYYGCISLISYDIRKLVFKCMFSQWLQHVRYYINNDRHFWGIPTLLCYDVHMHSSLYNELKLCHEARKMTNNSALVVVPFLAVGNFYKEAICKL